MTIKALPSVYAGIRFRSRLEARWAIFFDQLGVKWEYEPEGFDLDGVPYLPDFRLVFSNKSKQSSIYAEIKPTGAADFSKARRLVDTIAPDNWAAVGQISEIGILLCEGVPSERFISYYYGVTTLTEDGGGYDLGTARVMIDEQGGIWSPRKLGNSDEGELVEYPHDHADAAFFANNYRFDKRK